MNPVVHSSVKQDWQTPKHVLDLVRAVAPIALDPCTTASNPTGARKAIWESLVMCGPTGISAGGLSADWHAWTEGRGLAYVNPPYGRALPIWANKIVEEAKLGCQIIALVPSRTDTKWWQHMYSYATSTLLWRGRIKFKGATSGASFPSSVFLFGDMYDEVFYDTFDKYGVML